MATIETAGGYRYIPHAFQYSGGVEALPGYRIERVEFSRPILLAAGFTWIEGYFGKLGVPLTGFCACELRSPEQFSDQGFIDFNRHYTGTLLRWGVMKNAEDNPVARSNVIPLLDKPAEPSFHAFCFARPAHGASGSFVIAGSGEASDEAVPYAQRTIRYGETTADAMREKTLFVVGRMDQRMAALGKTWADTTATQIYRRASIPMPRISCAPAPPGMACCGTTPVHRSKVWNSRWTAAGCRWSTTSLRSR